MNRCSRSTIARPPIGVRGQCGSSARRCDGTGATLTLPTVDHHRRRSRIDRVSRAAQPRRVLRDRVEHRLDVRRRAGDHPQDLARRRLLLQRFLAVSLNRRTFSMAITAWSAKVLTRATCRSVNGCTKSRHIKIVPVAAPSRRSGTARTLRAPDSRAWTLVVGLVLDVVCSGVNALDRSPFRKCTTI